MICLSQHICNKKKISGIVIEFFLDSKKAVYVSYSTVIFILMLRTVSIMRLKILH